MGIASVVQFRPDLALNLPTLKSNIRNLDKFRLDLYKSGSEIAVFPELTYCGYNYLGSEEAWLVASPNNSGSGYTYFSSLAKELEMFIIYGFIEASNDHLFNSANLIGPDGQLIHTYQKSALWGNDFLWAHPGEDRSPVIDTSAGRTLILICNDLTQAIKTPLVASGSIDTIASPCNWKTSDFPNQNWMDSNRVFGSNVLVSNRWGLELNQGHVIDFGQGGSCIIDKSRQVHMDGIKWGEDSIITARLP